MSLSAVPVLNWDSNNLSATKVYAVGIGYFSANGDFDTCIALRTAVSKNSKFYVQAGAGIVADSKPINEYKETVNKAKAFQVHYLIHLLLNYRNQQHDDHH